MTATFLFLVSCRRRLMIHFPQLCKYLNMYIHTKHIYVDTISYIHTTYHTLLFKRYADTLVTSCAGRQSAAEAYSFPDDFTRTINKTPSPGHFYFIEQIKRLRQSTELIYPILSSYATRSELTMPQLVLGVSRRVGCAQSWMDASVDGRHQRAS